MFGATRTLTKSQKGPKLGILTVQILSAKDLEAKDLNGKSDPFCEIQLLDENLKAIPGSKSVTQVKKNTLNPVWENASYNFEVGPNWHVLRIRCWDKDLIGKDFLGEISFSAQKISDSLPIEGWKKLTEKNSSKHAQGEINIKIKLTPVGGADNFDMGSSLKDDPALCAERENWKINPQDVTFQENGLLGKGAFGRVDLAVWRETKVAVKTLFEPVGENADEFYHELDMLCRLRHPNVIQLLGYYFTATSQHLVTEFLEGSSLRELLQTNRENNTLLESRLMMRFATDIAKGMMFLHTSKPAIIHRDLKPANILIQSTSIESTICAKLADFGIAKQYQPEQTTSQKGTITYMAPEIFKTFEYTPKVDVYSFAVVLWEMISGQKPWTDMKFHWQIEENVVQGTRPNIPNTCPSGIRSLIEVCWNGEPNKRPDFSLILASLNGINFEMIDSTLQKFFKEKETVPWPEFVSYASKTLRTEKRELETLKPILSDQGAQNALRSAFGGLVQWFGPIIPDQTYEADSDMSEGCSLAYIAFMYRQPWFHGKIDAVKSIERLSKQASGSFLIRLSSEPGTFTLSYNAQGKVYHKRIVFKNGVYFLGGESFDHLKSIVTHFNSNAIDPGRNVCLKIPCPQT